MAQPTGTSGVFLSLVVPCYNEEESLGLFLRKTVPVVEQLTDSYEIVCVNDGSSDSTLELLGRAHAENPRLKIVNLSRNFGKEVALTAGIDYARGDIVIPIDADLQHPPELIPQLVAKWREGYDMVVPVKSDRSSDTFGKRLSANMFYRLASRITDTQIPPHAGDFRLMNRAVVDALKCMPERNRFMKGLFAWLGFRQATVPFIQPSRAAGESKWNYWKLWNFALEGIFSFTILPLKMWTYLGLAISVFALFYILYIFGKTMFFGIDTPGYASTIVIILFFSGMNMIGLGILGEYVGRIFLEVKQRPLYLVRETVGFESVEPVKRKPRRRRTGT
jgi:glycosyltransferase involved in cell wall biosynthesis